MSFSEKLDHQFSPWLPYIQAFVAHVVQLDFGSRNKDVPKPHLQCFVLSNFSVKSMEVSFVGCHDKICPDIFVEEASHREAILEAF